MYMYVAIVSSSVDGYLGFFDFFSIVNSAAVHTDMQLSMNTDLIPFCYIFSVETAGSDD